jgi:anthranilate phosphoribosyltransferase
MHYSESLEVFEKLFSNQMSDDEAKELLVSLYERGESASEIAAAASVMRKHSIKLEIDESLKDKLIDVVGTGGDKSGSFNVSSTVSLVLSSMGCYVAKHGNRSITSKSGSADMLEALGINLNLSPDKQSSMLQECGFTFMFAQNHHPAMKYIMPIRKSLSHRSIFNILGPLTNPASASRYLLGVFDRSFITKMADALMLLDTKSAYVVSSRDGMDEVSVSDISYYAKIDHGSMIEGELNPEDFGIKLSQFDEIKGGEAKENAIITLNILDAQEKGAKRDIVVLNSALAFVSAGMARDIQDGIEIAKEALDSKKAREHLKKIIKVSHNL